MKLPNTWFHCYIDASPANDCDHRRCIGSLAKWLIQSQDNKSQQQGLSMRPEFDHFGVPEENIRAAAEAAKRQTQYELHSYVPTRKEVATLAAKEITEILTNWMCRSPIEIVPSRSQIIEVKIVLLNRPDASELSRLVTMCEHYINNG